LKIQHKKIILYGHSDGGSIALLFASKFPKHCQMLITEAAHVFVEPITINGIKPAVKAFKEGKLDGLKKYHGENFTQVFFAWVNIWNHPSFLDWNIEKEIRFITIPNLIIQGINDQYGTLEQVESIYQNTKGESIVFTPKDCGHAPFKEKKTEVTKAVIEFITSF
jgi:pimeloyl-ACP methyl ester carboxylesterase